MSKRKDDNDKLSSVEKAVAAVSAILAGLVAYFYLLGRTGSTSERSHKNIPFLWSSLGFGVFIDSGARIRWDLGTTSLQSWTFEAEAPALEHLLAHRVLG